MKTSYRSHHFSGWPRLFEGLLTALLVVGVITAAVVFAATAFLTFADEVPEFMANAIELEVGPSNYHVAAHSDETPLPEKPSYVEVLLPIPLDQPLLILAYSGTALVGILLGLAAMFQLWQFVRSLRRDHPFIPANAHRLRCIAWLMLFGGIWKGLLAKFLTAMAVNSVFPDLNLNVNLRGEGIPLLTVFTFFIIAEVFALGVKMKEEADLTV